MFNYLLAFILVCVTVQLSAQSKSPKDSTAKSAANDDVIYEFADEMPAFPGGIDAYKVFVQDNLKYPAKFKAAGIVHVSILIDEDGNIIEQKVVKDIGGGAANAALDVVKAMPKWSPGSQNGNPVKVRMVIPVKFVL